VTLSVPPVLDTRDADTIASTVLSRIPGYVPGWVPDTGGAGTAMAHIYGRLLSTLGGIINQAPAKNELACFDQLGIELLAAQAARAPVVFAAIPAVGNSQIPAGSGVGAQIPGRSTPLMFQTEQAIGLAAADLVQVVSLWPQRDAYADHSAALQQGRSFTLFQPLQPVDHTVYLGDETVLALAGQSIVEVHVDLRTPASSPLDIAWEYWDGGLWRKFKDFQPPVGAALTDSVDGTNGLTRSGTIRLASDCAKTVDTTIDDITARWLRGRLAAPLILVSGTVLPEIGTITIDSVIDRTLPSTTCAGLQVGAGIQPDAAFADKRKLDLTKAIQPLGQNPQIGSTFYVSCDEAMTKPKSAVTLCFKHVTTPDESLDGQGAAFGAAIADAIKNIIAAAQSSGGALINAANAVHQLMTDPVGAKTLGDAITAFQNALSSLPTGDLSGLPALDTAAKTLLDAIGVAFGAVPPIGLEDYPGQWFPLLPIPLWAWPWLPVLLQPELNTYAAHNNGRIAYAADVSNIAADDTWTALDKLAAVTGAGAAGAGGATLPSLATPVCVWEYWNGTLWSDLHAIGSVGALNLTDNGPVTFTVPDDAATTTINGTAACWFRARVTAGGYGVVQTVTWTDQATGLANVFPIILIRPPVIDTVALGYMYRSPRKPPESCVAYNDFQFIDYSRDVHATGTTVSPYAPVADKTPAIYLGFNKPLPADLIGLYFDIDEVPGQTGGPSLNWEYYNGSDWLPLQVKDETTQFALPGIVSLLYPGVPPQPSAAVASAHGVTVQVTDPTRAAAFAAGDLLYIAASNGTGALCTLASVSDVTLTLTAPLSQSFAGASIGLARLPRFGKPCTWVRARLTNEGDPLASTMNAIAVNAVWASQQQTIRNETMGSSSGAPSQVFFFKNTPVLPGEEVEICELTAPRASVEESMFRAELAAAGVSPDDIRSVADPKTGLTTAIWVRWHEVPTLLFAGPKERSYALERSTGQLVFGGNGSGLAPVAGVDNVRATQYQTGGGVIGNVSTGAITKILAGVTAASVTNPRAAEGGADGESLSRVTMRAPRSIRARLQAVTAADYEAMAIEASPAVAVSRALPTTDANGRFAPGSVSVIIVPQSADPQPFPSFGLRQEVKRYVAARAPASVAAQIFVEGPDYLPVGVAAAIQPVDPSGAGAILDLATQAVASFLHPLTGGPAGMGWPFGRDVFLSDVAAVLAAVRGVDYVASLSLLLHGAPQGESVTVPSDRLVAAGPIQLTLAS
jgi:hypothetical protein